MKFLVLLIALAISFSCPAQTADYKMSEPINIPQLGWNKTLIMQNGNILLFHFEPAKAILVKVFDSACREIATASDHYITVNENAFERCIVEGIYEIGGEAVIFLSGIIENKESLTRLRYDANTGKLVNEHVMLWSKTFHNATVYKVLKNNTTPGYVVGCFRKLNEFKEEKTEIIRYNSKHDTISVSSLDADGMENYNELSLLDMTIDPYDNINFCLNLLKQNVYGIHVQTSDFEKTLAFYYLPANSVTIVGRKAVIPTGIYPDYTFCTFNAFDNLINFMAVSNYQGPSDKEKGTQHGIRNITFMDVYDFDLNMTSEKLLAYGQTRPTYKKKNNKDSNYFKGKPLKMYTNENGLTTIISEENTQYDEKAGIYTCLGDVGITQLDDSGKEIWGMVIPKQQVLKNDYYSYESAHRGQLKFLFRDEPGEAYSNQFASLHCIQKDKSFYILLNNSLKNFEKEASSAQDSIYSCQAATGVYYKLDKQKTLTKGHIFGEPAAGESKACMLESQDYDKAKNLFSCLILHKSEGKTSTRLGLTTMK